MAVLERIYDYMLEKVVLIFPDIEFVYILENWRSKFKKVMLATPSPQSYTPEQFAIADVHQRIELIRIDTTSSISYVTDIVLSLNSLAVPLSKLSLHNRLVELLSALNSLYSQKLELYIQVKDEGLNDLLSMIEKKKNELNEFIGEFLLSES